MRKKLLSVGLLVAVGLVLGAPGRARACGGGGGAGLALLIVGGGTLLAAADIGLTVKDFVDKEPSRFYGGFEAVFAGLQTLEFGSFALQTLTSPGDQASAAVPAIIALWAGALTAHGVYVLAGGYQHPAPEPAPDEKKRQARIQWGTAPVLLSSERTPAAPGGMIYGRF